MKNAKKPWYQKFAQFTKKRACGIKQGVVNYFKHFYQGDYITKLSYVIMGFGCLARKQIIRGLIFLVTEIIYILFMLTNGNYYIKMLGTLGVKTQGEQWNEATELFEVIKGDNSMLLLLFGVSSIILTFFFILIYFRSVKMAYDNQVKVSKQEHLLTFKEDWNNLWDRNYSATVLLLPLVGIFLFTVVPLIFTITMAFTNFDKFHQPPGNLFTWVGFSNFSDVLWNDPLKSTTFLELFKWTIIWAIFATFLNYIIGIVLALLINKKGIKFKGFWRTIFVITIAVPQFVSLLLMAQLLHDKGALNTLLLNLGWIKEYIPFLTDGFTAKVTVIVVNLWVGVPYTMLITSGILMNIPKDLYEASKIDGANPFQQFIHITMPYMLHVTTPYLITQFVGNINNFNVIYLLSGGGPLTLDYYQAGKTDLLVTWLYKLTITDQNYALASTIGIFIFVLVSTISLIVYNNTNAIKEEEAFQ